MNRVITVLSVMLVFVFVIVLPAAAWTLAWDASTGNPEGYIVEISNDGGTTWANLYVTTETSLFLDDKIPYNQTFSFRVSAYNAAGVSEPCPAISWTRPRYVPPAEAPLDPVNTGPTATPTNPNVTE